MNPELVASIIGGSFVVTVSVAKIFDRIWPANGNGWDRRGVDRLDRLIEIQTRVAGLQEDTIGELKDLKKEQTQHLVELRGVRTELLAVMHQLNRVESKVK